MKIAHGTLVLAADGGKAVLFRNEGDEKYAVLETLAHEEFANPPTHEVGSDRPGRSFSSTGRRRSAFSETDWHRQGEERFARRAADMLGKAVEGNDAGLVIVAPAQFLGSLRNQLKPSVKRRLLAEIAKDLVHHETDDIVEAIARNRGKAPAQWH